jgi:hypothetical protein
VARREEKRSMCGTLVGKSEEKNHLVELGVIGRIILKWNRLAGHRLI